MNINKTRHKITKRNKLIGVAALALLALLAFGLYFWFNNGSRSSLTDQNSIDYNPPSQDQKEDGERTKDTVINSKNAETPEPTTPGQKKPVSVTIVDAGQYERTVEVRAFAGDIAESDGTCTITFTKGASTLTKTTATIISANTTQCVPLKIASAEFPSLGDWSVIVEYTSPSSSGKSPAQTIVVK